MTSNPLLGELVPDIGEAHLPGHDPIKGQHVRLERVAHSHRDDIFDSIGAHHDLWTWWPEGPFSDRAEFDAHLDGMMTLLEPDLAAYSVIPLAGPAKDRVAGVAFTLAENRTTHRVGEIGMVFGHSLQRTRAATEVVYLLSDMMFRLNYRRLQWKTNALNAPSIRAAKRYGFVYEGTLRQNEIRKGRNRDTAWFSIIDSEWPFCKSAFEKWLSEENFDEEGRQQRRLEEIRTAGPAIHE
jgi:RimJ/RimL family protein N-acetyltransferase